MKGLQLERDFGGRISLLFIIFPSERCIHEDCTEGVVVKKDDKTVLLFVLIVLIFYCIRFAVATHRCMFSKLYFSYSIMVPQLTR